MTQALSSHLEIKSRVTGQCKVTGPGHSPPQSVSVPLNMAMLALWEGSGHPMAPAWRPSWLLSCARDERGKKESREPGYFFIFQ